MKKVLVIDDAPEIRMVIEETLGMFGFATVSAEDGETGVKLAQSESPNLIICDVNMPKMDGFETLARLRQQETTAAIPFMFLSGAVDRPQVRRGMEMGADDYLTKPFTPSELLAAVNARLEKQAEIQRQSEKRLDELRGAMTLALPHELRTPLNGIMGLAGIMMEDHQTMTPADVYETSKHIYDSSLRLHRLIENFLAHLQIELLSKDPRSVLANAASHRTDVVELVSRISSEVAARWNRSAWLQCKLVPGHVAIAAESLSKIVEELVDNAFKFSDQGTTVSVTGDLEGQQYVLRITNDGRGMTAQQIASIGPHIQFDRDKYEQQGAGLGLIIAKRLTELNGGRFQLQSVPGAQTTAEISFPAPAGAQG